MRSILSAIAALICCSTPGTRAGDPYALDATVATNKKEVQLAVPTNGLVSLGVIKLVADAPATVRLHAGPFRSEADGRQLNARLEPSTITFASNQMVAQTVLQVSGLRPLTKYSGALVLSAAGLPPMWWNITLSEPTLTRPATLVVTPLTIKQSLTGDFFVTPAKDEPQATLLLADKTGKSPIEGLGVSAGTITTPDGSSFDLSRNVTFFIDGKKITNFTQVAPGALVDTQSRSTGSDGRAILGLAFHDLDAGQYTAELKFFALNSQDDPLQKVTVTVQSRHSVLPAAALLVAALGISFVAYKWLKLYRERLDLRVRIAGLRPGWLFYQDPVYSVVWVRTMLKQAEELTHQLFMVPSVISQRLEKLPPVLAALNEAGRAEEQVHGLPGLVKNRFRAFIAGHVRSMSDNNMDKAVATKARDELALLNNELASNKWRNRYQADVEVEVDAFLEQFIPKEIVGMTAEQREKVLKTRQTLVDELSADAALEKVMDRERTYAKLKLVMERRHDTELFCKLLDKLDESLEDVIFPMVDLAAWEGLKRQAKADKLVVRAPTDDGPEPLEAYCPLKFFIESGDKRLNETYLFNRGLQFKWRFELRPLPPPWRRSAPGPGDPQNVSVLEPATRSPRIAQFAPIPGKWIVSAEMLCDIQPPGREPIRETIHVPPTEVDIATSSELGVLESIDRTELWAFVFAALFAVVTGLATFYYKNPIFGSMQDYIALFLWGATIDQTKNFLREMQSGKKETGSP